MEFDLEQAIIIANQIAYTKHNRNLTDVEIAIIKGAWYRQEYEDIAANNNYSTSYLSQDVAPKLWKYLSEIIGEKVRKSNFKEALKRYKQEQSSKSLSPRLDTLPLNSNLNLYVERKNIESICCQALSQPGGLLRLKGSRLLGKTSLMNKVLIEMKKDGYTVVNLSLKLADKNTHFTSLDRFLRWFCSNISLELGLPSKLDEYWDEADLGSKVSCTIYLQNYLLAQLNRPLVLSLDDVDLLFPYPEIYEDFFALLRSWYEKARTRKRWQHLRLAIIHATDVYIRLNIYQSPFNVGFPQDLPEFTIEQTQELATKYKIELSQSDLTLLMDLVGGHPFLLQKAFNILASDRAIDMDKPDKNSQEQPSNLTVKEILAEATTESGIYSSHLRDIWLDLSKHPELARAFDRVLAAKTAVCLDPVRAYQLQNIGLIKLSGNRAQPRCKLYRDYFAKYLISS